MWHVIESAATALDQGLLQPVLTSAGLFGWHHAAVMWLLLAGCGLLQLLVSAAICMPLERWRPLTSWPDRNSIAVDILYAVFTRIVVLPLVAYFEYGLLQQLLDDSLAGIGLSAPSLPGLLGSSALAFLAGFVILDLTDYWQHRFSHRIGWWYGVHSVHHAEEQMTFWSDERTHVLEEAITYVWLIIVGLLIGIPAIQFPFMILGLRLIASVSHANTSVSYSWLGERLFVSPRFHRVHHALRYGSNRNMGTALPWWDMLWGTADFTSQPVETGDLSAEAVLASGGWFAQQRAGLRRMATIARRRRQRRRRRSQHAAQ